MAPRGDLDGPVEVGMKVQFFSAISRLWLDTEVTKVSEENGFQMDWNFHDNKFHD